MTRTPCPNCNISGRSEFPGQIVSFFTNKPSVPCGCGDGFVDEIGKAEKAEKEAQVKRDDVETYGPDYKDLPIPTGLRGLDKILNGGWRPGLNVCHDFTPDRIECAILHAAAGFLAIEQYPFQGTHHWPHIPKQRMCGIRHYTSSFSAVLSLLKTAPYQLVFLAGYKTFVGQGGVSTAIRMHALTHAIQESGKTVVMFDSGTQINTEVSWCADTVLESVGTGTDHRYITIKNRYTAIGTTEE